MKEGVRMEEKKITIYSYSKVWNVEKKIYNIGNIILPVPVELWSAVYFAGTAFVVYILQKVFPVIMAMPVIIRLGIIPYGIMYLVRRIRLDGKNPVKYFAGILVYLLHERYTTLERFEQHGAGRECVIMHWNCSMACVRPDAFRREERKEGRHV